MLFITAMSDWEKPAVAENIIVQKCLTYRSLRPGLVCIKREGLKHSVHTIYSTLVLAHFLYAKHTLPFDKAVLVYTILHSTVNLHSQEVRQDNMTLDGSSSFNTNCHRKIANLLECC